MSILQSIDFANISLYLDFYCQDFNKNFELQFWHNYPSLKPFLEWKVVSNKVN